MYELTKIDCIDRIEWRNKTGKLHRVDGPAIEWRDGDREWYINDELHRLDGPAIEFYDGTVKWYINGKICNEQEWFELLSEEQKLNFLFKKE